jgi:hypothetical protein
MSFIKVKAVTDSSGDWYVIPNELLSKFNELNERSEYEWDIIENEWDLLFNKYRTGGDLNLIQLYINE